MFVCWSKVGVCGVRWVTQTTAFPIRGFWARDQRTIAQRARHRGNPCFRCRECPTVTFTETQLLLFGRSLSRRLPAAVANTGNTGGARQKQKMPRSSLKRAFKNSKIFPLIIPTSKKRTHQHPPPKTCETNIRHTETMIYIIRGQLSRTKVCST